MKNLIRLFVILVSLFIGVTLAQAADVGFSLNVNVGEPPVFIAPPSLGFYVAVGVPYDMFLIDTNYYMYRGGGWYVSSGYNGPWAVVQYNRLPRSLRSHKYKQIIIIRDQEYRNYRQDQNHYRGKQYRPEKHGQQQGNQGNSRMQEGNNGNNGNNDNNGGGNRGQGHGNK